MKFSCCFIYKLKKSKLKAKLRITHWLIKVTVYIRIVHQQHGRTRQVSCAIPPQCSRLCAGPVPPTSSQFSLADRRHSGPSSCRLSLAYIICIFIFIFIFYLYLLSLSCIYFLIYSAFLVRFLVLL